MVLKSIALCSLKLANRTLTLSSWLPFRGPRTTQDVAELVLPIAVECVPEHVLVFCTAGWCKTGLSEQAHVSYVVDA